MTDQAFPTDERLSIAAVERETGVSKDALRVWERRYGFPRPERGVAGERMYPAAQVERLRIIKRLLDGGHRPGKTVGLGPDALAELGGVKESAIAAAEKAPAAPQVKRCVELIKKNDVWGLRAELAQELIRRGLGRLTTELIAPLNVAVGNAWMRGEIEVFQEHAYSQVASAVLRAAIDFVPGRRSIGRPRVVLTTLPGEPHALGLLMAESMMTLEGCTCLSLGTQTPVADICAAARIHSIDIVALSFTGAVGLRQTADSLAQLRNGLDTQVEIWAGGQFAAQQRKHLPAAVVIGALDEVATQLRRWRERGLDPQIAQHARNSVPGEAARF